MAELSHMVYHLTPNLTRVFNSSFDASPTQVLVRLRA